MKYRKVRAYKVGFETETYEKTAQEKYCCINTYFTVLFPFINFTIIRHKINN